MGRIYRLVKKEGTLPDGAYPGLWSGYIVDITYHDEKYQIETDHGVRGINISCVVIIKDGVVQSVNT